MTLRDNGRIPFVDLKVLHREIEKELVDVFRNALATAGFIGGPAVEGFENAFAEYCDSKYCVGVGSGTDALRFALMAAGISAGDIVLTVPLTFIATGEGISQAGAQPDFVDVDERTYTMDPVQLRRYLETQCDFDPVTRRCIHRVFRKPVTAIVPVHLYGQTADMDPILELAEKYNLVVVEDACQAHGAEYFSKKMNRWRKAGSMGQAAAFSFYPGKNLGACGEGGAVTTDSEEITKTIRMIRDHGQSTKYHHDIEGYNGRLDSIQAGILSVKLPRLTDWNQSRREAAERYTRMFGNVENVTLPDTPDWARPVWHLYVVRTTDREGMKHSLAEAGVETAIHYPIPLHLQKAYKTLDLKEGSFPVSERLASHILSLPMYPQLREDQQGRVVQSVLDFALRKEPLARAR